LRDYGTQGQLGLEKTPDEYVANMVAVFREVRRVLKDDGVLWLNLGDSYNSGAEIGRHDARVKKGVGASGKFFGTTREYGNRACGLKPKNLVGIPWRVAFALQQPYERHVITDPVWRGWFAGLVDGEGCYSCVAVPPTNGINESHSTRLQIRMADIEAVEHVVAITGMNSVTYDQHPASMIENGQRPAQQWKVSGDKMADLTADIFPFLTVKRRQAIVAWNLQSLKVPTKRGQPIPESNMEKRRFLYNLLHDLNQRRQTDLPSWLSIPTYYSEQGWYLRSDCIWSKPNPMPESVTDRPTKAHEYIFLMSKSARYYYDAGAIAELAEPFHPRGPNNALDRPKTPDPRKKQDALGKPTYTGFNARWKAKKAEASPRHDRNAWNENNGRGFIPKTDKRNKRSVWTISTRPYHGSHFATFPEEIPRLCILAGSRPGDVVLDPFGGTGTTAKVALELGRKPVHIDLSYHDLARVRATTTPALEGVFA